jgi:hypothetical protein
LTEESNEDPAEESTEEPTENAAGASIEDPAEGSTAESTNDPADHSTNARTDAPTSGSNRPPSHPVQRPHNEKSTAEAVPAEATGRTARQRAITARALPYRCDAAARRSGSRPRNALNDSIAGRLPPTEDLAAIARAGRASSTLPLGAASSNAAYASADSTSAHL